MNRRDAGVQARAPGRVNLLGEHTDYTGGLVLPAAIDRYATVRAARRSDGRFRIRAADLHEAVEIPASSPPSRRTESWSNYVLGVIAELWPRADLRGGCDLRLTSDVPIGEGLSSSAAVTLAAAFALNELFQAGLGAMDLARLAQRAERNFARVNCGIMDPACSALARRRHLLMLNCRTLETKLVPFPDRETVLAVIPSGVQRRLAGSTYNRRVRECGRALEKIRDARPSLACLGELTAEDLSDLRLTPTLARRVRHVVFENQRVRSAVESLTRGDLASFGRRMFESHESLSRDFEVSCPELDAIVDTARSLPDAVIGAKMTGAGFGGAVVAVVRKSRLKIFERAFRRHPGVLLARTSDGAGVTRGRGTP